MREAWSPPKGGEGLDGLSGHVLQDFPNGSASAFGSNNDA